MKGLIKIYIVGALEIICKFLKKYLLRKRKKLIFKGNKMKGGNKDALQSSRGR